MNLAGTQVTAAMVYLTDLLVKGVDFYSEYAIPFGEKLDKYGFGELFPRKTAEISIPLAALNPAFYKVIVKARTNNSSPIPSDVKPKLIGKANVSEIRKMIEVTLKALDDTLDFISTTPEVINPKRIDIITYLVGLFIENDISTMNDKQKTFLINWVNTADFINNSNKLRRQKYIDLLMDYNLANAN